MLAGLLAAALVFGPVLLLLVFVAGLHRPCRVEASVRPAQRGLACGPRLWRLIEHRPRSRDSAEQGIG